MSLKRFLEGALLALFCSLLVTQASAQTNRFWNGSGGSDWFNATNWIPVGVPGPADNVTISNGTVSLTAPVTFQAQFNWLGGGLSGEPLTIASNAVLNIGGGGSKTLYNLVTNLGTVNFGGSGALVIYNYNGTFGYMGGIYNQGLFDIQSDQNMGCPCYGYEFFNNAGLLRKSAGTGTTAVGVPVSNSGAVEVLAGTLNFQAGGVIEGSFSAAAGSSILFSGGSFRSGTPAIMSGAGAIQFTGGSLLLLEDIIPNLGMVGGTLSLGTNFQGGAISNLTLTGSTLSGNYTVSGILNWNAGGITASLLVSSNGVINIGGGGSKTLYNLVTNLGTVNFGGSGALVIYNYNGTFGYMGGIYNQGLFDIQSDQNMGCPCYGYEFFNNAGLLRKSAGTGTSSIGVAYLNAGILDVETGAIQLTSSFSQPGGIMDLGLNGAGANGRVAFSSGLSMSGILRAHLNGGYEPAQGTSFTLLTYPSRTNTFAAVDLPGPAQWEVSVGPNNLVITATNVPSGPVITTQPQSQFLASGAAANFSVVASGIEPLTYQWMFNGTNIAGETQSYLTISNVQSNNAGAYQVAVSDIAGTTLSATAILDVFPALLADYTFNGTGDDAVSNSFPMQLINTAFVSDTLFLNGRYEFSDTNGFRAIAMINGFSYNSFTVALDFNPTAFGAEQNNILMGGAGYRWLGFDHNAGHLEVTWNNHEANHLFTNSVVVSNQWQKLVCSVDLVQDRIVTFLNGNRLEDVFLPPGFQFNVQGTPNEPNEKNFTFTDYAIGQVFYGYADNLLVFGRALSPNEIAVLSGGPPVLLTQPQPQLLPVGATAQFSVLAAGPLPLSYQWLFNGATIAGATGPSYSLTNVQNINAGAYQVIAANSYGSTTSAVALLTIQAPPSIVTQPQSQTVAASAPASFSVFAVGSQPLSYQWYYNGTPLSGASSSTLTFLNAYFGNGGHYQVVVGNAYGSVASSVATLSVITTPVLLQPPDSAQVAVGDTAVFNVIASSSGSLNYQWFLDGSVIPGATQSSLTITNAQFTDAGNYSVLVSNLAGSVLSPDATLLVLPAVAPPPVLATYTVQMHTGLNLIANQLDRGGNSLAEILPVVPDGTVVSKYDNLNGIWGQAVYSNSWGPAGILSLNPGEGAWLRSPTNFSVVFAGTPHTSNIPLFIPQGAAWLASRQTNAPATYESIVGAAPAPGATVYQWINSNATFAVFTYTVTGWPGGIEPLAQVGESLWIAPAGGEPVPTPVRPLITQQPLGITVGLGGLAVFTVAASGTEPLSYQWRLNGNAIPGATTTILSIGSVQPANAGNYDVVVNNAIGITGSALATLTISNLVTLPFADDFENAGSLGLAVAGTGFGQNVGATLETNEPPTGDLPGGASVWLRWQAPADGVASFTTAGSDFDTVLAAYTNTGSLSISNLASVAADDDSAAFLCSLINFNASAGTTYFLQVDGYHGATGEIHLSWSFVPTVTTPPVILTQPQGETVVAGSNLTLFVVVQPGPPVSYQWFSNNIPLPGQTDSALTLSPAQVGIYVVGVTNTRTGAGLFSAAADIQVIIPGAGQRGNPVNVRSEDKFLAATDLTPPDPNVPHDPATASGFTDTQTFSTVNATADPTEPAHCGYTACKSVWNSYSNQVSGMLTIDTHGTTFNAILEVYTGPGDSFATLVPVACSANHGAAGESVTFPANGGTTYWVVVDGVNCASGNVTLNYNLVAVPTFTASPVSRTVAAGSQVTLSGTVVGAPTLRYQWRFNGTNISGATGSGLTLTSFQAANQGNYSVVCFNSYGSVTSLTAQVLLNNPRFINTVKSGSSLQTTFVGLSYTNYIIEASSNLTTWFPIKTNSSAIGVFNFTDPLPAAQRSRFYRGRQR